MQKIFIIISCLYIAPTFAMTRCVALSESTTSCTYSFPGNRTPNWKSVCTTNGEEITFRGTSLCSRISGSTGDCTFMWDEYVYSPDSSSNVHCWCNITSPMTTGWAYAETYSNYTDCIDNCSASCSAHMRDSADFRRALFEHIWP